MRKRIKRAVCAVITLMSFILSACAAAEPDTVSFEAMDTLMTLTVYGDGDICQQLKSRIEELDGLLDATDENSEIFKLNRDKTARVSEDTAELLSRSLELCGSLSGSFDITVYPAVLAWGFTTGEYRVPEDEELSELCRSIDYRSVEYDKDIFTVPDGVTLDPGAVAKGYAADKCREILSQSEARAAVLNLGGTVCMYGQKPDGSRFRVGIADPENPAGYFGYLSCGEGVIATSGGYERYFVSDDGTKYIHILDPDTAKPVDNGILSVTVCCENGAEADAVSTALFVMGPGKAEEFYRENTGFDFIILTDDNTLYITEGIYDDFTLAQGYDFEMKKTVR